LKQKVPSPDVDSEGNRGRIQRHPAPPLKKVGQPSNLREAEFPEGGEGQQCKKGYREEKWANTP